MNIGFIGFGEAGSNIALGLHKEVDDPICAFDIMTNDPVFGERVHTRAEAAGTTLVDSYQAVAEAADVIIAPVPPDASLEAAKAIAPFLRPNQIYADVSSSTPEVKKAIGSIMAEYGIPFADAAMLGALTKYQHRVPIVASGSGAEAFAETMNPRGMKIRVVEGEAGAASAIKLVRSIFMKGYATLIIETLLASEAYGVTEDVVSSISESMANIPFEEGIKHYVIGTAINCRRRIHEMEGSIQMTDEVGITNRMAQSTKEWLMEIDTHDFATKYVKNKPSDPLEVIRALRQK